jgi:acetamidase/formamidase
MTDHHLPATPGTIRWGAFDAAFPPVLEVESGDVVTVDCLSGEPEDLPAGFVVLPEHREVLSRCERGPGPHLVTGPIAVRCAEPGDALEVRILDIKLRQNWGWNLIAPGLGTLPEDFPELRRTHIPLDMDTREAIMPWGSRMKLRPFMGVLASAPPPEWGRITTILPREHGGNMDNKELVAGTTLYLPVWNEGGLFLVGDGHGVQGDGEVCVTAIETALTGIFQLILRKGMRLERPQAETPEHHMTMAFDPDLDEAVKIALRDMIKLICARTSLSREDAYMLCSLAADLRVTQTVDINKGIHVMLPKAALPR